MKLYDRIEDVDFTLDDCSVLPDPGRVLLTSPDFFDVEYVINPHMEGHVGDVDVDAARDQWARLREGYTSLGYTPNVVQGADGLPDMVFCANQTLPFYRPDGTHGVILGHMHAPQRKAEVPHYERYFRGLGFDVIPLPSYVEGDFEGMGDALWHARRYLLWGGYGFRTDRNAYEFVAEALDVRVLLLRLEDPEFYHLDTCLSILDEHTALIYPGAFDDDGLALLRRFFDRLVEAPEDEARTLFACNAHCPDGTHVLIQRGCVVTNERLRGAGFTPLELHTDEFLKAGGSVFCMKLMFWA